MDQLETLITFIQTQIHTYLIPLGGVGVFFASLIEEIVAPIPSSLVILGSSVLFLSGPINLEEIIKLFSVVVLPVSLGVTIGSLFVYGIAYFAGKPILVRWGKWLGLSWDSVEKLQQKFADKSFDEWALTIARAVPVIPSVVISTFSGIIRFSLRDYLICTFLGTAIRATALGFVGWQVGDLYTNYARVLITSEKLILGLIVAVLIVSVAVRLFFIHKNKTAKL